MSTSDAKLVIKSFSELTSIELYEILKVRAAVFVVEQACIYQDIDDIDYESMHVFYELNGSILAYLRIFHKVQPLGMVQIGRVLTIQRGTGLGEKIITAGINVAKETMHAQKIYIEAQSYAIGFYEKVGFKVTSEEFLEDDIPHVQMMID